VSNRDDGDVDAPGKPFPNENYTRTAMHTSGNFAPLESEFSMIQCAHWRRELAI
jgi:hypothetical protein